MDTLTFEVRCRPKQSTAKRQEPCVSQSVLISAASQVNGTDVKRIDTNEDCLGLHRTSKVRVSMVRNYYHFKDLVIVSSSNWWISCGS